MKIKIVYTEDDLLGIDDRSEIETLIIDIKYDMPNLIINNFTSLKLFYCCNTEIEKLEIKNCNALEVLKVNDNLKMNHLEAQSANFKICSICNLPSLKLLDLRDINSIFVGPHNLFILDIIATGLEVINLEYCLNLTSLVILNNLELNQLFIRDIYQLKSLYTDNNGKYNTTSTNLGVKNRI